ncbi:MAG: hypothetical protein ABID38_00270 [Candidatus Diapherotrites archaeon]
MDLKEQEERLKFLISRIDSEIEKFKKILAEVEGKRDELDNAITKKGLQSVPINIAPHSMDKRGLYEELQQHILDLNKLKNLINSRLDVVIKEEELILGLKEKYGKSVNLEKNEGGEFEVSFKDAGTENAYSQIKNSRRLIEQLKESIKELE